jgi:hypothetical protein
MEKISLPTKTKIAAWWMILSSILTGFINLTGALRLLNFVIPESEPSELPFSRHDILVFIGGAIFAITSFFIILRSSIFLLKQKRWAWKFSTAILFLYLIISLLVWFVAFGDFISLPVFSLLHLIPLILLLLDRKNFWKIAS